VLTDSKLGDTSALSAAEVDAASVRQRLRGALARRFAAALSYFLPFPDAPLRAQGASGAALWQLAFLPDGHTRAAAALEWGAPLLPHHPITPLRARSR
jgi:hypothetical protein